MLENVRVRELRWEAEGVVSLELAPVAGPALPVWEPGAHVDVELSPGLIRQYSLCGDPASPTWRIAVLLEKDGRGGSAHVHSSVRPGDLLGISEPRNTFRLESASSYAFYAGGIGITPLLPMIERIAATGRSWHLTYLGRRRRSMAFLERLEHFRDFVTVAPSDEVGRFDLTAALSRVSRDSLVYACGPSSMLEVITEECARREQPCRIERFSPLMDSTEARSGSGFEVHGVASGVSFFVDDGESILEVAERRGLRPPSSCMEGTCGTCETAVIGGVVDHRDSILTAAEREASKTMMICVSRSLSPTLTLDL